MPHLDGCDTSFGKSNKPVVNNLHCIAGVQHSNKLIHNCSSVPIELLVQTHPPIKYGVNHFPSLLEVNDEHKGRFETITTPLTDDVQLGHEQLTQPCICTQSTI